MEEAAYYSNHNNIAQVVKTGFVIDELDIATVKDILFYC